MIYVGIDLHSTNMVIVATNSNGDVVKEAKIQSNPKALERFFTSITGPVKAVVECTSFWFWLSDWFRSKGIPLVLAHAKMVKAISYAKVKTDKVDARTLAELLKADLIPEAFQVEGDRRELRELTRGRLRMIQQRSKLQAALWNLAAKYNVDVRRHGWRYPKDLRNWLTTQLPESAAFQVELKVDQVIQLQRHIGWMEDKIEMKIEYNDQVKRLLEIPGFGLVVAWTVLAEIGDIHRFPTAKQFTSYCRLVPGSKDSGGKHRHKRACKDGNRYLHLAFSHAAIHAYSHYKPVAQYYRKIRRRSGVKVARAVIAKELAKIVWHMLSKDQAYKGFKGQPTRTASRAYWPQPISPHA